MADYISREAFLEKERTWYCENCDKRKGMKKGKLQVCYEIGSAPCRACAIDDVLTDLEDFPAADVREVVLCKDCTHFEPFRPHDGFCKISGMLENNDFFCAHGDCLNCEADMRGETDV